MKPKWTSQQGQSIKLGGSARKIETKSKDTIPKEKTQQQSWSLAADKLDDEDILDDDDLLLDEDKERPAGYGTAFILAFHIFGFESLHIPSFGSVILDLQQRNHIPTKCSHLHCQCHSYLWLLTLLSLYQVKASAQISRKH